MRRYLAAALLGLVSATQALAQQPTVIDGWTLTEDDRSCSASMTNEAAGIRGFAAFQAVPSDLIPDDLSISIDLRRIASLRTYYERNFPMEVQATLPSGEIVTVPPYIGFSDRDWLRLTPRGFDRRYIAALSGTSPVSFSVRLDQNAVRTPNPDLPYDRAFSTNIAPITNVLAALDACKARQRASRIPRLYRGPGSLGRIALVICPYTLNNGRRDYPTIMVPGGSYRLKINVSGDVAEVLAPAAHTLPADRTNIMRDPLREIARMIPRMDFFPAYNSSLEPVEAWTNFEWPAVNCPADVER